MSPSSPWPMDELNNNICCYIKSKQSSPPRLALTLTPSSQPEELGDLPEVVDTKEALGLTLRVGAYHPREAEGACGKGLVGVGDEGLFACCRRGGEDCEGLLASALLVGGTWGEGGMQVEEERDNPLFSASSAPNRPASISFNTSGRCVATACSQCCVKKASSACTTRAWLPSSATAIALSARIMGRLGAGKSGGRALVMGTEKCCAQRRRSRFIQVSLSVPRGLVGVLLRGTDGRRTLDLDRRRVPALQGTRLSPARKHAFS